MEKEKSRSIMGAEIKKRIESDSWDRKISERVLRARKRSLGYKLLGSGVSAAAAAAVIFIFSAQPGDRTAVTGSDLHSFVSTQVESTYRQVFTRYAADAPVSAVSGEYGSYDAVDYVIADSLSAR